MNEKLSTQETQQHSGEFGFPELDAAAVGYENYLNNFQIDAPLAASFINRVLAEGRTQLSARVGALFQQAVRAAVLLSPFDPDILHIGAQSGLFPNIDTVRKVLLATNGDAAVFEEIRHAPFKHHAEEIRAICQKLLTRHPMHVMAADLLLRVDLYEGRPPDPLLERFQCPKVISPLWEKRLYDHFATMGDDANALPRWKSVAAVAEGDPFTLCRAAEMWRRQGRLDTCLALYAKAQALDPFTTPYALRMQALKRPFVPNPALTAAKKVCICLYSYNKATMMGETLESLAATRIGPARILVLLNGCTDHSRAVADQARALFPENEYEVIELPVNVGAPAARNWLLSQPAVRESEYVAFLDDDIYLQEDWLDQFLTVAESDPKIGNVGCKVVFPGEHPLLQYLYRHVSWSTEKAVRASLPTPYLQYDIGLYDVVRETRVVMGCLHLLRVASLADAPWFDIRYSPSQIDDTDHDLQLCVAGWKVWYCGTVTCVHRQNSGTSVRSKLNWAGQGNIIGNDTKFYYKWVEKAEALRALDSLSCAKTLPEGQ
ncbi:glycosyltransferase family 2 protein [Megalodesulfovibrio paquesii]